MHVQVVNYDPKWPSKFDQIKAELESVLKGIPYERIDHVGSTAVPGLAAKPVIDVDVAVKQSDLDKVIDAMVINGKYKHLGERGIIGRHAFKHPTSVYDRNVYVVLDNSLAYQNHIAVRDICRNDQEVMRAYRDAKLDLAKREWSDVDEYAQAKSDIIFYVLGKAGMSQSEREFIRSRNKEEMVLGRRGSWMVSGHND